MRTPFAASGFLALFLTGALAAQTGGPITSGPTPAPVTKRGLTVEIRDVARLPDTRKLRPGDVSAHHFQQTDAVHLRQPHVEDDDVGPAIHQLRQRLLGVDRDLHVMSEPAQEATDHVGAVGLIFDHQNARHCRQIEQIGRVDNSEENRQSH